MGDSDTDDCSIHLGANVVSRPTNVAFGKSEGTGRDEYMTDLAAGRLGREL